VRHDRAWRERALLAHLRGELSDFQRQFAQRFGCKRAVSGLPAGSELDEQLSGGNDQCLKIIKWR
jgi:hypothetical protein